MAKVAHLTPIADTLAHLRPAAPLTHGGLTVIPLLLAGVTDPGWRTLADAGDAVTITEVSEAGAVPSLQVTNTGDHPVLLLDGEQLIGARQNRVLNTTVLVAGRATTTVPVSCVEQGRWAYRSRRLSPSDAALYAELRRKKASPTGAMHDVYERFAESVKQACETLAPVAGQVGAVFHVGGDWAGLDLLASPGLFARCWARLGSGYAADALLVPAARKPRETAGEILARVMASAIDPAPAVGLGAEYRLSGCVAGAALVAEDWIAHLMAFPVVESD